MAGQSAAVTIRGGPELRQAFREVGGPAATKRLAEAQRPIAIRATEFSRGHAVSGNRLQQRMAFQIIEFVTQRSAGVRLANNAEYPAVIAAFMGLDRRTGWFARQKYNSYNAVDQGFLPYRGNSWQAGIPGQGPRAVNEGIADTVEFAVDTYEEAIMRAARDVGLL